MKLRQRVTVLCAIPLSILLCLWALPLLQTEPQQYLHRKLYSSLRYGEVIIKHGNDYITEPLQQNTIYGLVHIAKTGGTWINFILSSSYERVCGNKGYSNFGDADGIIQRYEEKAFNFSTPGLKWFYRTTIKWVYDNGRHFKRPIPQLVDRVGFSACDFIIEEVAASYWNEIATWAAERILELHIPCRESVDHLMSMCNHRRHKFSCQNPDVGVEIKNCILINGRFDENLIAFSKEKANIRMKCFDYRNLTSYIALMDTILEKKKVQPPGKMRPTKSMVHPREPETECVWTNATARRNAETEMLKSNFSDYFKFCSQCLGSSQDLFSSR